MITRARKIAIVTRAGIGKLTNPVIAEGENR